MHAYSQDLRDRVLGALQRGERPSDIARRYEVSRLWVYQVRKRFEASGQRHSLPMGGHRRSRIAHREADIRRWIEATPDITLAELSERLAGEGLQIKVPGLWHQLDKWGLSFKKTLHASEQSRDDVQQARADWKLGQPSLDPHRLVFLDETWATTCMTRMRGRSPRGMRCVASAPHGHWKTTTFIAGLRQDAITAPMVLDGPMNGAAFLAYVRTCLRVQKRAAWISRQLAEFEQYRPRTPARQYVNGESHLYLGRQYRLKVVPAEAASVNLARGQLRINLPGKPEPARVKALLHRWYLDRARSVFDEALDAGLSRLKVSDRPRLIVRAMQSRWGSLSRAGTMTLNVSLVRAPRPCIEYVVTHELCHTQHRDHDARFFGLLGQVMPDWEQRKQRLETALL